MPKTMLEKNREIYEWEDVPIPARPSGNPDTYTRQQKIAELSRCSDEEMGHLYFVWNYVKIFDNSSHQWIPFHLYPAQKHALDTIAKNRFIVWGKARQIGGTWTALAFALHQMLFYPEALVLLFSKREKEAVELLKYRLKKMYRNLPGWMRAAEEEMDSATEFWLSNGSRAMASSAGGSESYAATLCIVDECDVIHESKASLKELLIALEPTVASAENGRMILVSRFDKSRPESTFKRIFKNAEDGNNKYTSIFLPWYARPDRDMEWYKKELETSIANYGTTDYHKEMYPWDAAEAMASTTTGKRFPQEWIRQCYVKKPPHSLRHANGNAALQRVAAEVPHDYLSIFTLPQVGEEYIITVDGGEGGQAGDDSAATVFNWNTGEECASLSGKIETTPFAEYVVSLARFYNRADIFPERNNIGKTLILHWQSNDEGWVKVLEGPDSKKSNRKYGYYQDRKSKPLMWVKTADYLRDEMLILHSLETVLQLADVDGRTLDAATEGHDGDRAITVGLYCTAKELLSKSFLLAFV